MTRWLIVLAALATGCANEAGEVLFPGDCTVAWERDGRRAVWLRCQLEEGVRPVCERADGTLCLGDARPCASSFVPDGAPLGEPPPCVDGAGATFGRVVCVRYEYALELEEREAWCDAR